MGESTGVAVRIKNIERLISRCEDILGGKYKIKGQKWRITKVYKHSTVIIKPHPSSIFVF